MKKRCASLFLAGLFLFCSGSSSAASLPKLPESFDSTNCKGSGAIYRSQPEGNSFYQLEDTGEYMPDTTLAVIYKLSQWNASTHKKTAELKMQYECGMGSAGCHFYPIKAKKEGSLSEVFSLNRNFSQTIDIQKKPEHAFAHAIAKTSKGDIGIYTMEEADKRQKQREKETDRAFYALFLPNIRFIYTHVVVPMEDYKEDFTVFDTAASDFSPPEMYIIHQCGKED